jgi:hypothetical protein
MRVDHNTYRKVIVKLDGVEQFFVIAADTTEGWLIKYSDPPTVLNDRVLWHKLFGSIEVIADNLDGNP